MRNNGSSDTPSRAEVSGVMVTGGVFPVKDKPKTLHIIGGFSLGIGAPILGVFRYFNKHDFVFDNNSRWFVHATIVLFNAAGAADAGVKFDPTEQGEFEIMGDIIYASPAGDAPAKYPPLLKVCGRPTAIFPETSSFEIDVMQWVPFGNQKAPFFWSGTIPDGWTSKPMPNPNSPKYVCVSGTVTEMRGEGSSKRFYVEISSVIFLGAAPGPLRLPPATPTPKGKRKSMIDFEDKPSPSKNARV